MLPEIPNYDKNKGKIIEDIKKINRDINYLANVKSNIIDIKYPENYITNDEDTYIDVGRYCQRRDMIASCISLNIITLCGVRIEMLDKLYDGKDWHEKSIPQEIRL